MEHHQKDPDPFLAKNEITRTFYNKKAEKEANGYYPFGSSTGGGGAPFRDQSGNIIVSRKAAIQYSQEHVYQQKPYQQQSQGYVQSRIVKEEPSVLEERRQTQAKYSDELKRQIEDRDRVKKNQQLQFQSASQAFDSPPYGKSTGKYNQQNYHSQSPIQQKYNTYEEEYNVPYHNPSNLLLFSKVHSMIDGEISTLRSQAKNQQRMMQMQIQNLQMEANKVRFDASNAYSSYDTYNSFKLATNYEYIPSTYFQENEDKSHRSFVSNGQSIMNSMKKSSYFEYEQYQPAQNIASNSMMFPVKDSYTRYPKVPDFEATDTNDASFADILEIEQINQKVELDLKKFVSQTEKRYNTEKFLQELEMNREFPELKTKIEIERRQLLNQNDLKAELKKEQFIKVGGKDIVYELIEQQAVHEELDKIRRDLNEFSYRSKDASYLLVDEKPIQMKIQEPLPVENQKKVPLTNQPKMHSEIIDSQKVPLILVAEPAGDLTEKPIDTHSDFIQFIEPKTAKVQLATQPQKEEAIIQPETEVNPNLYKESELLKDIQKQNDFEQEKKPIVPTIQQKTQEITIPTIVVKEVDQEQPLKQEPKVDPKVFLKQSPRIEQEPKHFLKQSPRIDPQILPIVKSQEVNEEIPSSSVQQKVSVIKETSHSNQQQQPLKKQITVDVQNEKQVVLQLEKQLISQEKPLKKEIEQPLLQKQITSKQDPQKQVKKADVQQHDRYEEDFEQSVESGIVDNYE